MASLVDLLSPTGSPATFPSYNAAMLKSKFQGERSATAPSEQKENRLLSALNIEPESQKAEYLYLYFLLSDENFM